MTTWNDLKSRTLAFEGSVVYVVLEPKDHQKAYDGLNFDVDTAPRDVFEVGQKVIISIVPEEDESGCAQDRPMALLWEDPDQTVFCLRLVPAVGEFYEYPEEKDVPLPLNTATGDNALNRVYAIFIADPLPDTIECALGELVVDYENPKKPRHPVPVELLDQLADAVGPNACVFRKSFRVKEGEGK